MGDAGRRLTCALTLVIAAGSTSCGGVDRESWARGADKTCDRTIARLTAVGRPESIDALAPAAARAAQELRRAGREMKKLERPEKDPDITQVTRGFGAAAGALDRLAAGVTEDDDDTTTRALRSLERQRLRWEDAAVAAGARGCGRAGRLTAAIDSLRAPLYRAELATILERFEAALRRAAAAGRRRGPLTPLDRSWGAVGDLRQRIDVLEPPSRVREPARQWSRDIERLDFALFDFIEATGARRERKRRLSRRLRGAARAELRSRRRVLRLAGLEERSPEAEPA